MNKEDIIKSVYELYEKISDKIFPYKIDFSSKMTRGLGKVVYSRDSKSIIRLVFSNRLLTANNKDAIIDVITHELTHVYTLENFNYAAHDNLFFSSHKKLFGVETSTTMSFSLFDYDKDLNKFIIKCEKCGEQYFYQKETRVVKVAKNNIKSLACGKCKCNSLVLEVL